MGQLSIYFARFHWCGKRSRGVLISALGRSEIKVFLCYAAIPKL